MFTVLIFLEASALLLSLNNIYPTFSLNKLQENNSNEEEEVGIIKLHKDY